MTHKPPSPSLTDGLVGLLSRPVAAVDRERAMLHLVDWLGCALAGRGTPVGRILGPDGVSHLAQRAATRHDLAGLAFGLGGLGSILEMDDVDRTGLLHPGPVVIPAVVAVASEASGHAFLDALVRGYEAMVRLGRVVGSEHYAFFHNTSTCGGFGAAAGAADLLGLDRDAFAWALGNAVSATGGFWQCRHEQVMTKPYHCAEASRRGTMAALMAQAGLTGPRYILEGPQGMFRAICRNGRPEDLLSSPDAGWLVQEVSFKPWPACRHAHAAIDAALALKGRLAAGEIAAIEIVTYADAVTFCDRASPRTETEARFSLQHSVSVALTDGPPPMQAFAQDALDRPEIAKLRSLATVVESRTYSDVYPRHFGSEVTLVARDGRRVTHAVADAWGDSENPMSRVAILSKCEALLDHARLPAALARRLTDAAFDLVDDAPAQAFRQALADAFLPN